VAPDTGPTALDYITLGVALFGALLATASLVWQLVTWRTEGALVRVDAPSWAIVGGPSPFDGVAFNVRNVGRSPVGVNGIHVRVDTQHFFVTPPMGQVALPTTLNGLHSVNWAIPKATLARVITAEQSESERLRVGVTLATGQEVWSPKRKPLSLEPLHVEER
jgi:hypothetical protein